MREGRRQAGRERDRHEGREGVKRAWRVSALCRSLSLSLALAARARALFRWRAHALFLPLLRFDLELIGSVRRAASAT